jgi:type VI secretion system secreted protein Hcp
MAYEFYVTVEGRKQGKFKGESAREAHRNKVAGLRYRYEVTSPRDMATGQASGKRQHGAIQFTKEWGAATPQFFQALVTNEVLSSVLFEFVRTSPEGVEEVHTTIRLTNATVASIEHSIGDTKQERVFDTAELETVSFTFQRIEIENKYGKTAAADDWTK